MFRYVLPVLAALVLVTASLIPDDAFARRGGGGGYRGGGGFHGGAVRLEAFTEVESYAGRVGVGRVGYRGGYYPRRGYGAAAVGAAAVGAAAYGCLRRLQQLLRRVRQLYLRPVSILTRAERMPTAVGPVLTAVPFSCVWLPRFSFHAGLICVNALEGRSISLAGVAARLAACAANADFYRAQTASKLSSISAIVLTPHNPIVVSISLARMSSALATPACPPAPRP